MPSTRSHRRAGGAWLLLCLTTAGMAHADAIDVSALAAWRGRPVSALELSGLPADLAGRARSGLALVPRRKLLSVRKTRLDLRLAAADASRLRLLLARNGYPEAQVAGRGEADGDDDVKVTFTVSVGPAVSYGALAIPGLPAGLAAAADSARIQLPVGARFRDDAVDAVRAALILVLHRAGYAHPQIEVSVTRRADFICDLVFACSPGPLFAYDALRIDGAPPDLEPLARRVVALRPGTPYSPRVAADARRYLRDLDLFRQIRLRSVPRDSSTLDLSAELVPRRMLTALVSVGTFTDNPIVARAYLIHRNLWRRGRGLAVGGSYATHLQEAEIRSWWHALVSARSRTDLRLRYEIQDEDSYRLDRTEAEVSTLFRPWVHSSLRVGLAVSNGVLDNRSADPSAFESDVGLQTVISAIWYRDTSDNPLTPFSGRRFTLRSDVSVPGFLTDSPFASIRAFGSQYIPLGGRRVLAVRLDAAVAWPLGDAVDLTPDRRWFAGGVSSMRGYERHRLGPLDSAGQPIGGETRLLAGAEARVPIVGIFGAAVFLDSGQVWRYRDETDLGDLAVAGGAGLLVGTPIGPVRFDVAYNLTPPPSGEPRSVFHFAIGHPF